MPIMFGSINTGLPPNIVDQLIDAERIPVRSLQKDKEKAESKSKLVDDLTTKISDIRKGLGELASTHGFSDVKVISGDPGTIEGTVDPGKYQPGSWNVEVVQLAEKAAAITNGFPDKDKTQIGVGYFRFKTPDGDKDVRVYANENTLDGAAKAINDAKVGVRATVIDDRKHKSAPFKLMLTSDGVGADKGVQYPRIYMLDGDQDIYFDQEREAKNGSVKVDGFEFEIADNTLKDVIPGVTLNLKQANPGKAVNLTVKEDQELVSGKIKTFVDGMNGVLSFIQAQNKLDKTTDTTKTLGGDSLLRSVESRMRELVQSPQYGMKGSIRQLDQLGIQYNRSGTLDFDQKKFNAVLAGNPDAVQQFFVGDGYSTGFVNSVKREVSNLLNPSYGPLTNRSRGLKDKIDQIDGRIEQKERQIEQKEKMLREKFSRLEEQMSKIRAQGAQVGGMMSGAQQLTATGGGGMGG